MSVVAGRLNGHPGNFWNRGGGACRSDTTPVSGGKNDSGPWFSGYRGPAPRSHSYDMLRVLRGCGACLSLPSATCGPPSAEAGAACMRNSRRLTERRRSNASGHSASGRRHQTHRRTHSRHSQLQLAAQQEPHSGPGQARQTRRCDARSSMATGGARCRGSRPASPRRQILVGKARQGGLGFPHTEVRDEN